MYQRAEVLAKNIALRTLARERQHARSLAKDRVLKRLVKELVAARTAAGITQEDVAARMFTTKSVVSRLESGVRTRPTLRTIENYALAVGARVEIRVRAGFLG